MEKWEVVKLVESSNKHLRIRPYRVGDLDVIIRRPADYFGEESTDSTRRLCEANVTFTFEKDGLPVGLCGVQKLWDGVAHVWAVFSDSIRGCGLALTKDIKIMLDDFAFANDLVRLQANVRTDQKENKRWLILMGFDFESTMLHACPGGGHLDVFVRFYHGRSNEK